MLSSVLDLYHKLFGMVVGLSKTFEHSYLHGARLLNALCYAGHWQ